MNIKPDFSQLLAIYALLLAFGMIYNQAVAWAERNGYLEGYMSLVVAAGVAVNLIALAIISPLFSLITLGAFLASGLPMILGSIARHISARAHDQESIRDER